MSEAHLDDQKKDNADDQIVQDSQEIHEEKEGGLIEDSQTKETEEQEHESQNAVENKSSHEAIDATEGKDAKESKTEDTEKNKQVQMDAPSKEEKVQEEQKDEPDSLILKESASQDEYFKMIKDLVLSEKTNIPESYFKSSAKEEALIAFVENFIRQYKQIYPNRRDLLILSKNEYQITKFVCSTIRPTQLKFKELYSYHECARFVSDYLSYEILDPPYELPPQIPSPTFTFRVQSGNCFDYSILLCSFLRGAGYDAYVVSGYASKDVTLMDDSRLYEDIQKEASPFILESLWEEKDENDFENSKKEQNSNDENNTSQLKYKLKPLRQLKSNFIKNQGEKEVVAAQKLEKENLKKVEEEKRKMKEEMNKDDLKGMRVHAWVLVLPGKREISEPFFIEPTTGKTYSTSDEHYLGVESVFNNVNYWVNMQICYDGLKGISFDLGDNACWEFVFIENSIPGLTKNIQMVQGEEHASDDEDEEENNNNSTFDLPPSWVAKIELTQEQFERRCPSGRKITLYTNAITETFAEYQRKDGMVYRVVMFADEGRKKKREVQEYFSKRKDKLVKRLRLVESNEIHEFFDRGRLHSLKKQIILNSKMKEMHFYSSARHDGLVKRIESIRKVN